MNETRPMRRLPFKRRLQYLVQAAPVLAFFGVAKLLPYRLASVLGGWVAGLVGPLLPVSKVGLSNLRLVYPHRAKRELQRILRGTWRNLGRTTMEFVHLHKLQDPSFLEIWPPDDLASLAARAGTADPVIVRGRRNTLVGADNFATMMLHDGPAIAVAAHIGNWETLPEASALLGMPISVVYQPAHNPYIDRLIARIRKGKGDIVARDWLSAGRVHNTLSNGGRIGILADQRQILHAIKAPFLGRPALTGTSVAKLAIRYRAPVFGTFVQRDRGTRFTFSVTPPIWPPESGSEEVRVRALVEQINAMIGDWVLKRPDQWLWLHRRWKTADRPMLD